MFCEDSLPGVNPSHTPIGEEVNLDPARVHNYRSASYVDYDSNVLIPIVCAVVLMSMDAHLRTIGVTGVSKGFPYGGVNECAPDTSLETVELEIRDAVGHPKIKPDNKEKTTGPGYCAHKMEDFCKKYSKCTVKEPI